MRTRRVPTAHWRPRRKIFLRPPWGGRIGGESPANGVGALQRLSSQIFPSKGKGHVPLCAKLQRKPQARQQSVSRDKGIFALRATWFCRRLTFPVWFWRKRQGPGGGGARERAKPKAIWGRNAASRGRKNKRKNQAKPRGSVGGPTAHCRLNFHGNHFPKTSNYLRQPPVFLFLSEELMSFSHYRRLESPADDTSIADIEFYGII